MNKVRRKQIEGLLDKLRDIASELSELRYDEHEAFDRLPESIQDGRRGQYMLTNVEALDIAVSELEDTLKRLILLSVSLRIR